MKEESGELEYLNILKALMELPFNVGKNLLVDFLSGDYKNKSIINNKLDELPHFDSLSWDKDKIYNELEKLIANGMVESITSDYNRFVKVLRITVKGQNEIIHPTFNQKKLKNKIEFTKSEITQEDLQHFNEYKEFLINFNDEQKKAIISENKNIL
jgi:hypothetical protein